MWHWFQSSVTNHSVQRQFINNLLLLTQMNLYGLIGPPWAGASTCSDAVFKSQRVQCKYKLPKNHIISLFLSFQFEYFDFSARLCAKLKRDAVCVLPLFLLWHEYSMSHWQTQDGAFEVTGKFSNIQARGINEMTKSRCWNPKCTNNHMRNIEKRNESESPRPGAATCPLRKTRPLLYGHASGKGGGVKEDDEERSGREWRKTASACQEKGQSSETRIGAAFRSHRKMVHLNLSSENKILIHKWSERFFSSNRHQSEHLGVLKYH